MDTILNSLFRAYRDNLMDPIVYQRTYEELHFFKEYLKNFPKEKKTDANEMVKLTEMYRGLILAVSEANFRNGFKTALHLIMGSMQTPPVTRIMFDEDDDEE